MAIEVKIVKASKAVSAEAVKFDGEHVDAVLAFADYYRAVATKGKSGIELVLDDDSHRRIARLTAGSYIIKEDGSQFVMTEDEFLSRYRISTDPMKDV